MQIEETVVEGSYGTRRRVLEVKARASQVAEMYANAGLKLSRHSSLFKLLEHIRTLPDSPADGFASERDLLYALHTLRLSDALVPLCDCAARNSYLRKLSRGNLDFFDREESEAKNILWELEVWNSLRRRGGAATLVDPPDILLELPGGRVAIACKKIYSEKNVEKVLSQACRQVTAFDGGIAALNLDNLLPAQSVVQGTDYRSVEQRLQPICDQFRSNHERHMTKYLGTGRLMAIAMVVTAACDVTDDSPRFSNYSSSLFWSFNGLPQQKARLIRELSNLIATDPSPL